MRYLSIQQHEFVLGVVSGVLRAWLGAVLAARHAAARAGLVRCSAASMAALLKYWLKQSQRENSEKFDQLIRNFWQNVGSTVLTQIDKSGTDQSELEKLIEGHTLLLQTLNTTFSQEAKKQHSIKFDGDAPTESEKSAPPPPPPCDAALAARHAHHLRHVAHQLCARWLQRARGAVWPLLPLLEQFDSGALWAALAEQLGARGVFQLYDATLRGWLAGDAERCRGLVDVVFLLRKYLTEEEQDAMFDSFQQVIKSKQICV